MARSSAFGFYCAILFGVLLAAGCTLFKTPLLKLLGADATTAEATAAYMFWTVTLGAVPAILNVVMAYLVRAEGSAMHASVGTMSGCLLNIVLDPIFILPWGLNLGAAGAGLAWLLSMGLWQNVDRAADDSLGVLAPTLFIYALFLLPGEVLMAILSAILNSRGGGGGGGSGGGSIFRGGGGSSGGGGASGRW